MWIVAEDLHKGDYLTEHEVYVSHVERQGTNIWVNSNYVYNEFEVVDVNPVYAIEGVGTYRMKQNLTEYEIEQYTDEGLEVTRVD